ncbi:hypothetical protein ACFORG_15735 [Lutimaribacter marinistellae]|uniref:Uncharacterized protein n=1 Tax=Lutimaribacter marinistellae TaxID=1820329 RepID=A0ABV7TKC8_9RHOB
MGEVELAALLCAFLAGSDAETRQYFDVNGISRYVRVDCETESHVIEIGLDGKSSSRDSVHQALFAASLTGKSPAVILIDRDGHEGRFEYEMRKVAPAAGVIYVTCSQAAIERWSATAPSRGRSGNDLPRGQAGLACDLRALLPEQVAEAG